MYAACDIPCIQKRPFRCVEPFSVAAMYQPNVFVFPLPKLRLYKSKNVRNSLFRMLFQRGDIPCHISYNKGNPPQLCLMWTVDPINIDVLYYLPILFEGLCESKFPYNFLASNATRDILCNVKLPEKVICIIPKIVLAIKRAFNTRNVKVIMATLGAIQQLVTNNPKIIGPSLVKYYNQFLPKLNMFYCIDANLLHMIDFKSERIRSAIDKTMNIMEIHGGPGAYSSMKFAIPTYESIVNN